MRHVACFFQAFPARRFVSCFVGLVAMLVLALPSAVGAAAPGPGPQVGTNLGFLNAIAGEWPFVDVFKTSSGWYRSGACGWDCGTLDLDTDGWVRSLDDGEYAHALIFSNVAGKMPHGPGDDDHYVVLYDGIGVVDYDGSVIEVVSRSPGRDVVRVDPLSSQSFAISILKTAATWDADEVIDPNDYIRNIRVLAPGGVCTDDPFQACASNSQCGGTCSMFEDNYATQIFHPDFLNNLRNYDVIRLMDWMGTIEADHSTWAGYPKMSSARWNQAPAEVMAELANRLDADIWLNLPARADASYLANFPTAVASNVEDARKVYIEYANEIWNHDFEKIIEAVTQLGCALYLDLDCDADANPGNGIECEGMDQPVTPQVQPRIGYAAFAGTSLAPDCDIARQRYTVDRSIDAWNAFEAAFEADLPGSSDNRLVRVLATRTADTALHDALLRYQNVYQQVDAFASVAYFGWGLGGDPIVQSWQSDDVADMNALFARLTTEVEDSLTDMELDYQFLQTGGSHDYSGIPLVFYEGGPGIVTWGPNAATPAALAHANDVLDTASRDPRMGDRYRQLLDGWRARAGDTLFNNYVNCRAYRPWDRYGALEHQRQDPATAPKYQSLQTFIATLP